MARPERHIDPVAGPLKRFAADLRDLRRGAGNPSYRAMATGAHFAPTTLSEAAGGRRLPSLPVTLAYAQACGGDVESWRQRWSEVRQAIAADQPPDEPRVAPTDDVPSEQPRTASRLVFTVTVAIGLVAFIGTGWAIVTAKGSGRQLAADRASPAASSPPSSAPAVWDGADPRLTGCSAAATTISQSDVTGPHGVGYGQVELRYSAKCHAGWARYTPKPGSPDPTMVTIQINRPAPPASATVTFVVHGGAIYGDLEQFRGGCLMAAATVVEAGRVVASADTPCVAEPR